MDDYFSLFASPHREANKKLNSNCSAWSGHRFKQVSGTSQALCSICGDTITLTQESSNDRCYNFYGHKFLLFLDNAVPKGSFCFICGLTVPSKT